MLKSIRALESREAAEAKALEVTSDLERSKLKEAAKVVSDGYATRASRLSTGAACAPATPSSGPTVRSVGARSVLPLMELRPHTCNR